MALCITGNKISSLFGTTEFNQVSVNSFNRTKIKVIFTPVYYVVSEQLREEFLKNFIDGIIN